jgi:hypothetical protein
MMGERVVTFHTHYQYEEIWSIKERCSIIIEWESNFLCPNLYYLVAALYDSGQLVSAWENIGQLNIEPSNYFKTGKLPDPSHQGNVLARINWTIKENLEQ